MSRLECNALVIEADEGGPSIQMFWRGKSNDRAPAKTLGPYLSSVLAAAGQKKQPVEMHFETLDYFNSATITSIIQSIHQGLASGIPLTLVYDAKLPWQKMSFEALRVFERAGSVVVKSVGS